MRNIKLGRPYIGDESLVRTSISIEKELMHELRQAANSRYDGRVSALFRDVLSKQIEKWKNQETKRENSKKNVRK